MNARLDYSMSNNYKASMLNEHINDQQDAGIAELFEQYKNDPKQVADAMAYFCNDTEVHKLTIEYLSAKQEQRPQIANKLATLLEANTETYLEELAHDDYFKGNRA